MRFIKWRFFDQLHFLADSFIPRHTASNLDIEIVDVGENHDNTAASSGHRSVKRRGQPSADEVLPIIRQALAKMDPPRQVTNTPVKKKTEDETFAELICNMLKDIPQSYEKAYLRMTIQSEINKVKYKANNQVAFQVPSPMSPPIIRTPGFASPVSESFTSRGSLHQSHSVRTIHCGRSKILIIFTAIKLYRTFTYQVMFILDNMSLRIEFMLLDFKKTGGLQIVV